METPVIESSLKRATAKGLFWGGLGNGAQQVLGAAFGIAMARLLTQEDYGLVGVLGIFSGIAVSIINSGFSVALTNKKDAGQEDYNAVFWFTVFVGLALYGLLFCCAPLIGRYFGRPELVPLSRFLFLLFLVGGMGTASYTVMFKQMMTKQLALVDVLCMSVALSVGIVLALHGFAYWALAAQMVIQHGLVAIVRFVVAPWKPSFRISFSPLRPLLSFSFKLFLTNIFIQINQYLYAVIFGRLYSVSTVGIYNQGQKWMSMGQQLIGGTIGYITQPVLVQVNEDRGRQVLVFRKLIRFGAFVSFPLMLGLAFVGREFIVIALGEKWLSSVPFLQLACVWGSVLFLSTLYTQLIYARGKSDWYLYGTLLSGLLQLAAVVGLYRWGIYAIVVGSVVGNFIGLGFWQYCVSKLIRLRLRDVLKDTLPYLAVSGCCFFVAWLLTRGIGNLYVLMTAKVCISILLYIVGLRYSRSVLYRESLSFLLGRFNTRKGRGL